MSEVIIRSESMNQCLLTASFNMDSDKTELYLLIIVVKLSIFALLKVLKCILRAHKTYKSQLKKRYSDKKSTESSLAEIIVHHSKDTQSDESGNQPSGMTKVVVHNPSDLRNSATSFHHTDLKK